MFYFRIVQENLVFMLHKVKQLALEASRERIKASFINPTDAYNYKITGMSKQLKFPQLLRHVSVHSGTIIREPLRDYLKLQ